MKARIYNPTNGKREEETKKQVMAQVDMEGNKPCDLCWEQARDNGICLAAQNF